MPPVSSGPTQTAVPWGVVVELERRARVLDNGAVLLGGAPPRMLHLSAAAQARLVGRRLTVTDATSAALARRLIDAGIARPVAEPVDAVPPPSAVTVVIPVKDRTDGVARLLTALAAEPAAGRVVVVDDGSADPDAVRGVAECAGADVLRHPARPGRRPQRGPRRRDYPPTIYFRTLGCAKNQVDSEVMLGRRARRHAIAEADAHWPVTTMSPSGSGGIWTRCSFRPFSKPACRG